MSAHLRRTQPSISAPRGGQDVVRGLLFENLRPAPTPPDNRSNGGDQTSRMSTGYNLTAGSHADSRLELSEGVDHMERLNGK
jgi:hypothetical protein